MMSADARRREFLSSRFCLSLRSTGALPLSPAHAEPSADGSHSESSEERDFIAISPAILRFFFLLYWLLDAVVIIANCQIMNHSTTYPEFAWRCWAPGCLPSLSSSSEGPAGAPPPPHSGSFFFSATPLLGGAGGSLYPGVQSWWRCLSRPQHTNVSFLQHILFFSFFFLPAFPSAPWWLISCFHPSGPARKISGFQADSW